ncbi:hypothetical protein BGZ75_001066 [Mortierella antarctica]|nr:hypothetical protein BGZ75_001066 [Mortierella antarctica]
MTVILGNVVRTLATLTVTIHCFANAGNPWNYGAGPDGHVHWGLVDPSYVTCDKGMQQSPIDINDDTLGSFVTATVTPLVYDYSPINDAVAHWNGHAVEVDWVPNDASRNSSITIRGKQYNLIQFHFHTPSEHRIYGKHAAAELHMVHRSPEDGALAVVAVLLHARRHNMPFFQFLTELDGKVVRTKGKTTTTTTTSQLRSTNATSVDVKLKSVNLTPLIKAIGNFGPRWEYSGSLTTPPCSENVAWSVMQRPFPIGLQQLRAAVDLEGFNARETNIISRFKPTNTKRTIIV